LRYQPRASKKTLIPKSTKKILNSGGSFSFRLSDVGDALVLGVLLMVECFL
jgi:hypothetical protein